MSTARAKVFDCYVYRTGNTFLYSIDKLTGPEPVAKVTYSYSARRKNGWQLENIDINSPVTVAKAGYDHSAISLNSVRAAIVIGKKFLTKLI